MAHARDSGRWVHTFADRPLAYLLTAGEDGRPHATQVTATVAGGPDEGSGEEAREVLVLGAGETARSNAIARAAVSLLCPPATTGGYTLLIDGEARPHGGIAGSLMVEVSRAVLHRPGLAGAGGSSSCGSDCIPLS